jgi:hypothetical protein
VQGEQCVAQVGHPFAADLARELLLDVVQNLQAFEQALTPAFGEHDPTRARVIGIGDPRKDAERLELVDQLGHGLLGNAESVRKYGDAGAFEVEMREQAGVRAPKGRRSCTVLLSDARDGHLVSEARDLEEHL